MQMAICSSKTLNYFVLPKLKYIRHSNSKKKTSRSSDHDVLNTQLNQLFASFFTVIQRRVLNTKRIHGYK